MWVARPAYFALRLAFRPVFLPVPMSWWRRPLSFALLLPVSAPIASVMRPRALCVRPAMQVSLMSMLTIYALSACVL